MLATSIIRYSIVVLLLIPMLSIGQKQDRYKELQANLEDARKQNDYGLLATAYYEIARYEEEVNRNPELAFEQISRSIEYYELIKDSVSIMECKYHIARQLLSNGQKEDAYYRIQELIPYYKSQKDLSQLAQLDLQLYKYYFEKLEIDSCAMLLRKLKVYFKSNQDLDLELEYLYDQLTYNELLQDYQGALDNAELCINKSTESDNQEAIAKCYKGRGQINLKTNAYQMAIDDFNYALGLVSSIPYSNVRLEVYRLLASCYSEIEDYANAYKYNESYSKLQDSILNENRIIAVNNLTYRYESKEKATEIRLLEKDKEYVQESNDQQRRALIILGLALAGLLFGIYYIIRFYTDKIRSANIIEEQNKKINQQKINELQDKIQINSMQSMITGQEVERERIAKDLHDSLGGLLSTIKLQIDNIKDKESNIEKVPELKKATNLLDIAVSEVRTISQDLQPGALKRLGLVPAINDLVNRYQSSIGPEITFQHFGLPSEIRQTFAMGIYRIVQEILNNAIKHAKASEIFVQLNMEGNDLVIHIEDDGIGFDPTEKFKSMGLENIKSRVNYLKGTMEIDSRPNEGTSFIIHIDSQYNSEV